MAEPIPNPNAGPGGDSSKQLERQALALGFGPQWLGPLVDRVGPVVAQVLLKLLEGYVVKHPDLATDAIGPGEGPSPADHARYCEGCLEHLLAAAAVCLHHRRSCDQEASSS